MGKHLGLKVLWFQASVHEVNTTVCHVGCVLEAPVLAEASMDQGGSSPRLWVVLSTCHSVLSTAGALPCEQQ